MSLTGSNFEIDTNANLKVDDTGQTPASIDWASVTETRKADLASGSGDDSFGNGTKEDTPVPSVVDGSIPPNKSDLLNFGAYRETVGTTDFLHLFWHRVQEPQGTTNMDFEFNQSSTMSANGKTPVRTEGDLLIQYDLAQGGVNPRLFIAYWLTDTSFNPPYKLTPQAVTTANCISSNSFPCWGLRADLTAAGLATGSINSTTIPVAESDGLATVNPISVRTFGEASINFTQLLGTQGCTSFGSAYLKSRSSDSFTAAIKDFIAPTAVNISNCAKVIIRKQTDPGGATTEFGYTKAFTTSPTSTNTFNLADDGVKTFNGVFFGTGLTVEETTIPGGWKFDSVDCATNSVGVTPQISGAKVTFSLDASTDVLDCTYYNETGGTVIIRKETDPDGADASFGFETELDLLSGVSDPSKNDPEPSLKDGENATYTDVLLGTGYTISEDSLPPGWKYGSVSCTGGLTSGVTPVINQATGLVTFDIDDASDVLDCTYSNETGGQVIIHKVTQPAGDTVTSFDYSSTFSTLGGENNPAFALKDGETKSYSDVLLGTGLTVTEGALPTGWELVGVDCSASSGVTPVVDEAVVTFDIDDADDKLECTYTNRASGSITVEKITDSGTGTFAFTSTDLGPFELTTTAAGAAGKDFETFSNLDPGTYDVAETVPDNWNLVSATCDDDDGSDPASIVLDAGENITCTFHNDREVGAIEITKLRKHAADGLGENHPFEGVEFVITGGELPAGGVPVTTDENGVACLEGVVVSALLPNGGLYTITETVPDGYAEVGTQTANVTEAADCDSANPGAVKEFINTPLTKITVSVDSLVEGGTFSSIDCYVTGDPDGVIEKDGITDQVDDISLDLNDLEPGNITCDFVIDP